VGCSSTIGVKLGHFRRFARGFLAGVSLILLVSTRHVIVTCAAVAARDKAASQAPLESPKK